MDPLLLPQLVLPLLRDHLRSLGYQAEIVDEGKGRALWPGRELGSIALGGGPVDLLAVAMPGLSSARLSNWSHYWKVGRLPVSARKVWPVEYHYVLRATGLVARETFEARFLGADRTPRFRGGRLAEVLSADAALAGALRAALEPADRLGVRAEPRRRRVVVVHETRRVVGFALLPRPRLELEGGLPTRELVEAVGRVAEKARLFL